MLNLNLDKKNTAFTLVELMISVTIIGLLASVSASAFYKNILKSRAASAPLLIKAVYDAESVFASQGSISLRHASLGDIQCKPSPRFMSLCFQRVNEANTNLLSGTSGTQKSKLAFYSNTAAPTYSAPENTCIFHPTFGDPKYLDFGSDATVGGSSAGAFKVLPFYSHFVLRAKKDDLLAAEYSVNVDNTLMIIAIGDLDGDHDNQVENINCDISGSNNPSTSYFLYDTVSVYARSMHIDSEGEIQGSAGLIVINELE